MVNKRERIPGTKVDILGSFEDLEKQLSEGKITRTEYDAIFSNSRKHGLCGDIHPFALGGSDAAIVTGCSPWTAPSELVKEKLGHEKKSVSDKTEYLFNRGHIYESAIRESFSVITGLKTQVFPYQVVNERWPHCVANIDGIVWENGIPGILEIKSTDFGSSAYKSFFELSVVPEYYFCQIQFYMQVLGYEFSYIVCAKDFSERGMKYFRVSRDDDFGAELMEAMESFVDNISKGIPADDSIISNEKLLRKLLEEYCGKGNPKKDNVRLDKSLEPVFREYDRLNAEIDKLTAETKPKNSELAALKRDLEKCKENIARAMKDAVHGNFKMPGGDDYDISFPVLDSTDWGPGAKEYIRKTYPEVFSDAAKVCPQKRKLSVVKVEKGA